MSPKDLNSVITMERLKNNKQKSDKQGWRYNSVDRVLALQAQGPRFQYSTPQEKKKKRLMSKHFLAVCKYYVLTDLGRNFRKAYSPTNVHFPSK